MNATKFKGIILSLTIFACLMFQQSQAQISYQEPPPAIKDLVDAAQAPSVSISPDSKWLLLATRPSMPSVKEVAQPELRIGGLRINPRTNGPSRDFNYATGLELMNRESKEKFKVDGLPADAHLGSFRWSPDAQYAAFTHTTPAGIELWLLDLAEKQVNKLTEANMNLAVRGSQFQWSGDSKSIMYKSTVEGDVPQKPVVASGPVVSENVGKAAPNRTYQDLLKNTFDESLFEYYTQTQLIRVGVDGSKSAFGKAGMIYGFSPSPDGNYWMISRMKRPFSYLVPYYRFGQSIEIWDNKGEMVKVLANIPPAEDIPKGFGAVRKGQRSHGWRADAPATVYWVEAQDEGDPRKEVKVRDQLFSLAAPFSGKVEDGISMELRFGGIDWVNDEMAISREIWYKTRTEVVRKFNPSNPAEEAVELYRRSVEDRYNDPGRFVSKRNEAGKFQLLMDPAGKYLYRTGTGASPEGNRPFIDRYKLSNGKTERLWQSEAPYYAFPVQIIDAKEGDFIFMRESVNDPPNYFMGNWKNESQEQLTDFPHPYPSFANVEKQDLSYTREDGVALSGTLYTPPGYKVDDGPLPTFIWAYPREYKNAALAGQRSDSPYRFVRMYSGSPIFWVMRGYAVLNNASMPIIGEGETEPNDKFVEQLVMNAEAAIDKVASMGVGDRKRMAIGGHSYGAFMTANLLAHSDLFAAGIARSGAYNRTLTPFGFQREERTFWEAPEIYFQMSPFMHAQKVNEPILLIHGQADNNSGTFPMQSERYYNALKGHGATARLVMLPHESHGYRGRESVMHMLWEMDQWLEKHVGQKQ